jgi:hypothetical protein
MVAENNKSRADSRLASGYADAMSPAAGNRHSDDSAVGASPNLCKASYNESDHVGPVVLLLNLNSYCKACNRQWL